MKTSFKTIASAVVVVLGLSVSSLVQAQGEQPEQKAFAMAMFPTTEGSKVWLSLEKYNTNDKISVELINEKGQILFREAVPVKAGKRNGVRQQFDLSDIGDGKYTFRISGGNQTEERTFKLSTPTLEQQFPLRLISMN